MNLDLIRKAGLFNLPWTKGVPSTDGAAAGMPPSPDLPYTDEEHSSDHTFGTGGEYGLKDLNEPVPVATRPPADVDRMPLSSKVAPTTDDSDTMSAGSTNADTASQKFGHLEDLEAKQEKLQRPLGWKGKLLATGAMALPVGLGAAIGGREGAALAARVVSGAGDEYFDHRRALADQVGKQAEAERGRLNTQTIEQMRENATQPLRNAQISNLQDEIAHREDFKRNQAAPTINTMHDGAEHIHQWNPQHGAYDTEAGVVPPKQTSQTLSEFERDFQREHGTLPTLQDKIAYEHQLHPPTPHDDTMMPIVDQAGNITGWVDPKHPDRPAIPPSAPGQRKNGMNGTLASKTIQASAIEKGANDLTAYIDQNQKLLGPIIGRVGKLELLWGNPDPRLAELGSRLASWAALQPALHGFRGQQALREFDKMIGGIKMNSEALKAAIHGMTEGGAGSVGGAIKDFMKPQGQAQGADEDVIELEKGPDGKLRPKLKSAVK